MIAPVSLAVKQILIFSAQRVKRFSAIVPLDVRAEHEATRQDPAPDSASLVKLLFPNTTSLRAAQCGLEGQLGRQIVLHAAEERRRKQEGALPSW